MKNIFYTLLTLLTITLGACEKSSDNNGGIPENFPRTNVPTALQGNWMFGSFSMTEYWNQYPGDYLGNALEMAIAFKFKADGTYEQYFTSSAVLSGSTTYQQSVTIGTVEVDEANHSIVTHPFKAHYKRTVNRQVVEDRDLGKTELSGATTYQYGRGIETNGTPALYLKLGNELPLTFLYKP